MKIFVPSETKLGYTVMVYHGWQNNCSMLNSKNLDDNLYINVKARTYVCTYGWMYVCVYEHILFVERKCVLSKECVSVYV